MANRETAEQSRKYFKPSESVLPLGIKAPALRDLERLLWSRTAGLWRVEEATACCDCLLRSRYLESKGLGVLILSRYKRTFPKPLISRVEKWLTSGCCNNWAACDSLCSCVISTLLAGFPELLPRLSRWTHSRNLWLRRAAAVSLVPLARKGACLDEAYGVATSLLKEPDPLLHKATGWLLRECGKTDIRRLESYLLAHGPQIPRTALRYAIERFPHERRAGLLRLTRGLP
jgi:3-methyladenine DNA glycosylase AlkD